MNPYGLPKREAGTTGPFLMPVLTIQQFYDHVRECPAKLRAVFELADNVEHVFTWSHLGKSYHQIGRGRRPMPPPRFTGWDAP